MCTTIGHAAGIAGSGRSTQGWFRFDRVWLSYDHPFHAPVEHAVSVDFVDGSRPSGERVAVELTREAARQLALELLAVADQADAYETGLMA
jgi:hypothetical protein